MAKFITMCAFVLCIGSLSQAEEGKHHDGPCAKDRESLCGKIEPGEGRIMKCMRDNKDKVSAECKEHMKKKMSEHFQGLKEACHDDAEKLCSNVEHGEGRVMKCMKEHRDQLSGACKQEVEKMKEEHKHQKEKKS